VDELGWLVIKARQLGRDVAGRDSSGGDLDGCGRWWLALAAKSRCRRGRWLTREASWAIAWTEARAGGRGGPVPLTAEQALWSRSGHACLVLDEMPLRPTGLC
jgi:hypothetical protein